MDLRKTVIFIGLILFLLSAVAPFISLGLLNMEGYVNLVGLYVQLAQNGRAAGSVSVDIAIPGILLAMLLYPLAIILGFTSLFRKRIALASGILALACSGSILAALIQLEAVSYIGIGVYLGIIGSLLIIIISIFKKPPKQIETLEPPPPSPEQEAQQWYPTSAY